MYSGFQLNEMLEEKVRPYIQKIDNSVLSKPIVLQSHTQEQKVCPLTFPFQLLFNYFRYCLELCIDRIGKKERKNIRKQLV